MANSYAVGETNFEGYPAVRLAAPNETLATTFCPSVGMVGCSLTHAGDELLGQRGGLPRYEARGSTMGIPLLHPWANRLSGLSYSVAGRDIRLDRGSPLLRLDPNGLPIHGLLAASPFWSVVEMHADERQAGVAAELDFGAHPELLEGFPFPHRLRITIVLMDGWLIHSTTVTATGDGPVPIAFGYHPYLRLPNADRAGWQVELPPARRMVLDERMIPTGETEASEIPPGLLGERAFDDAFCALPHDARFRLSGGGRLIQVELLAGYDFAQVYAPDDDDVICFEPMTAATNALVAGGPGLNLIEPGESYVASFRIGVSPS